MPTSVAIPFLIAASVALLTTPWFRQLARTIGLVDRPAARKVHTVAVPYLGGLGVASATLAALVFAPGAGLRLGVVALIAGGMCVVGLFDDDRQLAPRTRLAVEVLAALATVAIGLRFEATGVVPVDIALTLIWIVGLTNAANLLDNMDGLGAGTAATVAGSSLVVMLGTGAHPEAAVAVAVIGACLGFLVYNKRPATVYMGDAGSLFLGYLLSVITLAATDLARPGTRLVVPLLLAAVPVIDTVTVVVARLRRGISPAQAGRDHLSHRLVARGMSPGVAVMVLLATSLSVGVIGALAARGAIPPLLALAAAAVAAGPIFRVALTATVYDRPVVGLPVVVRLAATTAILGLVTAGFTGAWPTVGETGNTASLGSAASGTARLLLLAAFVVLVAVLAAVANRRRVAAVRSLPLPSDLFVSQLKEG
jgi:UDP-GlcNAc:undecaprenyl-phosphate GlcNAc-1-phosphate transferase